jgi:hypothetical protein
LGEMSVSAAKKNLRQPHQRLFFPLSTPLPCGCTVVVRNDHSHTLIPRLP